MSDETEGGKKNKTKIDFSSVMSLKEESVPIRLNIKTNNDFRTACI